MMEVSRLREGHDRWGRWLSGLLGSRGPAERRRSPDTYHKPAGRFSMWTKRIGNNPELKVLLFHGGPGATHEYLEACDSYLPGAGIEYYYYDQLGSGFSDQPDDPTLWELDHSSTRSSRSAGLWDWIVKTSSSTASHGVGSSLLNTPWLTRRT
jgi:pimeloyl-ACP methyl ester carboxylesterase